MECLLRLSLKRRYLQRYDSKDIFLRRRDSSLRKRPITIRRIGQKERAAVRIKKQDKRKVPKRRKVLELTPEQYSHLNKRLLVGLNGFWFLMNIAYAWWIPSL